MQAELNAKRIRTLHDLLSEAQGDCVVYLTINYPKKGKPILSCHIKWRRMINFYLVWKTCFQRNDTIILHKHLSSSPMIFPTLPPFRRPSYPLHLQTNQSNTYIDWTSGKLITRVHNQDHSGQWNDERSQEQSALHEAEDLSRQAIQKFHSAISTSSAISSQNPAGVTLREPKWHIDETIYYDEGSVEVIRKH